MNYKRQLGNRPIGRLLRAMTAMALVVISWGVVQVADADTDSWKVPQSPHQAGRPALKEKPHGNAAIVRTVIDAVGLIRGVGPRETTNTVNRLRWSGDGTIYEAGHPVKVDYRYALSLLQVAAREDIQKDAADKSTARQIRVVHDQVAWKETTPGVATAFIPDQALKLRMKLWRTPFGIAKALSLAPTDSIQVREAESGPVQLDFKIDGVATHVVLDSDFRPWRVSQQVGRDKVEDQYSEYKDFTEYGLMFPSHSIETVNGKPYLDIHTNSADAGTYLVFVPPTDPKLAKNPESKRIAQ